MSWIKLLWAIFRNKNYTMYRFNQKRKTWLPINRYSCVFNKRHVLNGKRSFNWLCRVGGWGMGYSCELYKQQSKGPVGSDTVSYFTSDSSTLEQVRFVRQVRVWPPSVGIYIFLIFITSKIYSKIIYLIYTDSSWSISSTIHSLQSDVNSDVNFYASVWQQQFTYIGN